MHKPTNEQIEEGRKRRRERHAQIVAAAKQRILDKRETERFGPYEEPSPEERAARNARLKEKVRIRKERRENDSA